MSAGVHPEGAVKLSVIRRNAGHRQTYTDSGVNTPVLFQNVGSSFCAVYSVANLLEYKGQGKATRRQAFARFGVSPKTLGPVSHEDIRQALPNPQDYRWEKVPKFDFDTFRSHLGTTPCLVTFWIHHKDNLVSGDHCVVVVSHNETGIWVIDPHGYRNMGGNANARIDPEYQKGKGWVIEGTTFYVRPRRCLVLKPAPRSPFKAPS